MAERVKTGREQLKSGQLILAKRHWDFLKERRFADDKSFSETAREAMDLLMDAKMKKATKKRG